MLAGQICVDGRRAASGVGASYQGTLAAQGTTDGPSDRSDAGEPHLDVHQMFGQIVIGEQGLSPMTTRGPGRTYQYRTSRVAVGTFFLLLGAAFLLDSLRRLPGDRGAVLAVCS